MIHAFRESTLASALIAARKCRDALSRAAIVTDPKEQARQMEKARGALRVAVSNLEQALEQVNLEEVG